MYTKTLKYKRLVSVIFINRNTFSYSLLGCYSHCNCHTFGLPLKGITKIQVHFTLSLDTLFNLLRATLHLPPRTWWRCLLPRP